LLIHSFGLGNTGEDGQNRSQVEENGAIKLAFESGADTQRQTNRSQSTPPQQQ